jgi:hypothetical protein
MTGCGTLAREVDRLERPGLRPLDAIHLATADQSRSSGKTISGFVTYDSRLAQAAMSAGFTTQTPACAGPVDRLVLPHCAVTI